MDKDFFFNLAAGFVFIVLVCGSIILADYVFFEGQLLKKSQLTNKNLEGQLNEVKKQNQQLQTELKMASNEMNSLVQKIQTEEAPQEMEALIKENTLLKQAPEYIFVKHLEAAIQDTAPGIQVLEGKFIFQDDIFFQTASSVLSKKAKKALDQVAETIKKVSGKLSPDVNWVIKVMGHADSRRLRRSKPFSSNWILASSRAVKIVQYLISRGVDPSRLYAAGSGVSLAKSKKLKGHDLDRQRRAVLSFDRRVGEA